MAPVVSELQNRGTLEVITAVTGQHRELLDQVLELFGIDPEFNLHVMKPRQSLTDVTVRVLRGLEDIYREVEPDLVLVHGDTATTLAASLAAFYQKVSVGHVEAGLRTFDRYQPYPEEMNRVLTDHISELHFSPTGMNRDHLLREGVREENIFVTGNTAIDALMSTVEKDIPFALPALRERPWEGKRLVLVEVHRRESFGGPLRDIFRALARFVQECEEVFMVCSVHPNPEVSGPAQLLRGRERILTIDPVSYPDWARLMDAAHFIVTDSGGLQEEAPSLNTPVLVAREKTERQEAIEAKTVKKVGVSEESVFSACRQLLQDEDEHRGMSQAQNPYGDGRAAGRIGDALEWHWKLRSDPVSEFYPHS